MKNRNRIIATILSLIMIVSTVPIIAIAAKAPTLTVDSVEAEPGDTIKVNVSISGNTGIAGALIGISYDSRLNLISAENGNAFQNLTFTKPGKLGNPAKFLWDSENGMSKKDGTVLILTFKVADDAKKGTSLNVKINCKSGDFYDADMNTVEVYSVNGGVNIAKEANDNLSVFEIVKASIRKMIAIIIKIFNLGGKH